MDKATLYSRLQRKRLEQLRGLGVSDEQLATHIRELGQPCDDSALSHYRKGDRTAPLALLDLVLSHVDQVEQRLVLDLWARPYGLRVVPDEDLASDDRGLTDRVLAAVGAVGQLAHEVRVAQADGDLDPDERRRVGEVLERARSELAQLAAVLG